MPPTQHLVVIGASFSFIQISQKSHKKFFKNHKNMLDMGDIKCYIN